MVRHGLSRSGAPKWVRLAGYVALAAAVLVLRPRDLSACDLYVAYHPNTGETEGLAVGAGVHVFPGDAHTVTGFAPSVDLVARLGRRVVVRPTLGYCSYADQQQLVVGSGLGLTIANDGPASIGVQTHVAFLDFGRERWITLPALLTLGWAVGDLGSVYGGAGVRFRRFSYPTGRGPTSSTESRPTGLIGVDLPAGPFQLSGSAVVTKGDEVVCVVDGGACGGGPEAEWSFVTAIRLPLGEGQ